MLLYVRFDNYLGTLVSLINNTLQVLKQVEVTREHIAAATILEKREHRVSFEMDKVGTVIA